MWYAAHVIMHYKLKDGTNTENSCVVHENVFLIEARDLSEAWDKSRRIGKEGEGDDGGTLTLDGRPAQCRFAGIRKLVECQRRDGADERPDDGTELTYSLLILRDDDELAKLLRGEPAEVSYED
jgi:uncharacterized protein DUF4288